jgi:hypothetical protein
MSHLLKRERETGRKIHRYKQRDNDIGRYTDTKREREREKKREKERYTGCKFFHLFRV